MTNEEIVQKFAEDLIPLFIKLFIAFAIIAGVVALSVISGIITLVWFLVS